MRKVALALALGVALVSCDFTPDVKSGDRMELTRESGIRVVNFEGHEYLAYDMDRGGSLCHSETCPCKSSK